eukprot:270592-Rhodomonas_salina.2
MDFDLVYKKRNHALKLTQLLQWEVQSVLGTLFCVDLIKLLLQIVSLEHFVKQTLNRIEQLCKMTGSVLLCSHSVDMILNDAKNVRNLDGEHALPMLCIEIVADPRQRGPWRSNPL